MFISAPEQNLATKEPDFVEPARELFLWNVLMNRRDTAVVFWDEGRVSERQTITLSSQARSNRCFHWWNDVHVAHLDWQEGIAAALVAQKLLKGIRNQANNTELEEELSANATYDNVDHT